MTVELRAVTKSYGRRAALKDVSAVFSEGRHVAITGPSGCGKSTMLRLLAGLETPSSGAILRDGTCVSTPDRIVVAPHARGIGMLFQDLALWPNLSVLRNVLLGLSGTRLSKSEARERALTTLSLCGVAELVNEKPGQLSGGEQQRVALARAFAVRPKYLLLDEPFSNLDLTTKSGLLNHIRSLVAEQQVTLLLVTHDPIDAVTLCSSLIVMEGGGIKESGAIKDLIKLPLRSRTLDAFIRRWQSLDALPPLLP